MHINPRIAWFSAWWNPGIKLRFSHERFTTWAVSESQSFIFEVVSHCWLWLAWNSQRFTCRCLQSAGIKGVCITGPVRCFRDSAILEAFYVCFNLKPQLRTLDIGREATQVSFDVVVVLRKIQRSKQQLEAGIGEGLWTPSPSQWGCISPGAALNWSALEISNVASWWRITTI